MNGAQYWKLLSAGLFLLHLNFYGETQASELLDQISAANQNSLTKLSKLSASVSFEIENKLQPHSPKTISRAEYWRDTHASRISELDDKGREIKCVVYRDGKQRAIVGFYNKSDRDNKYVSAVIASDKEQISLLDVWGLALCYLPHEKHTLSDLLKIESVKSTAVAKESADGTLVTISLESTQGVRYEIRLAKSANYLIDQINTVFLRNDGNGKTTKVTREFKVEQFEEFTRGEYFPKKVVSNHYDDGRSVATHTAQFSALIVNTKIPEAIFNIKFPNNVFVSDHIRGVMYRADANEQPSGPVHKYSPVVSQQSPEPSPQTVPVTEQDKKWLLTDYIFFGSLLLIIIAIAFRLRSKLHRRISPQL